MCFTTGRGSAFGCKPTPSIKLATNTTVYERMTDDMDINCGDILDGVTIEEKGQEIFEKILAVASGEQDQVAKTARLRRQRVRALADRRDDVRLSSRNAPRRVSGTQLHPAKYRSMNRR